MFDLDTSAPSFQCSYISINRAFTCHLNTNDDNNDSIINNNDDNNKKDNNDTM